MPELVIKIIFKDFPFPAGPSGPRQPDVGGDRGDGVATLKDDGKTTGGDSHQGAPPYRGD